MVRMRQSTLGFAAHSSSQEQPHLILESFIETSEGPVPCIFHELCVQQRIKAIISVTVATPLRLFHFFVDPLELRDLLISDAGREQAACLAREPDPNVIQINHLPQIKNSNKKTSIGNGLHQACLLKGMQGLSHGRPTNPDGSRQRVSIQLLSGDNFPSNDLLLDPLARLRRKRTRAGSLRYADPPCLEFGIARMLALHS